MKKVKLEDRRYLICKHYFTPKGRIYMDLYRIEYSDFFKWLSTTGNEGTKELCWECYKHGKTKEQFPDNKNEC
jgi:hypothetical protein